MNISAMPTHGDTQRMGAAPPSTWHPQEEKGRAVVLHSQHPALQHRHLSSRSSHIQPPTICPKGWVNTGTLCPGLCCLHCHGPSPSRLHPALRDAAALLRAEARPKPLGPAQGHTRL